MCSPAGTGAGEAIVTGVHGIDVLPGSRELAGVELALATEVGRDTVLRDALKGLGYDEVVVDTPSNLGLLTVNALVAADIVVAPVAAGDEGAAQGLAELRATITELTRIRPTAPELAVIVTKIRPRRVMGELIEDAIASLGLQAVARVPDRTAVEQADVAQEPIAVTAPDSAVTLAYEQLRRAPREPGGDRVSPLRRRGLQLDDPLGPSQTPPPDEAPAQSDDAPTPQATQNERAANDGRGAKPTSTHAPRAARSDSARPSSTSSDPQRLGRPAACGESGAERPASAASGCRTSC